MTGCVFSSMTLFLRKSLHLQFLIVSTKLFYDFRRNSETQIRDNATNVETNMAQTTYKHIQQKTKFAQKFCRSTNVNYLRNQQDEQQEEVETDGLETENDRVEFGDFTSNNGWNEYQIDKFSVIAVAECFEIKKTNFLSEDDLNGHIIN